MRSILFVPANQPALAEKAARTSADVICIDLEDAVPEAEKVPARAGISNLVATISSNKKTCWLRVNNSAIDLPHDLQALCAGIDSIVLPKAQNLEQIISLESELIKINYSAVSIVAMLESVNGIDAFDTNQTPPSSLLALALGAEDLAASLGTSADSSLIQHLFHRYLLAAHRLGVDALGYPGSIAEFTNIPVFSAPLSDAARSGSVGGFAIHPAQVDSLNQSFGVSAERLAQASEIVRAFEVAGGAGVVDVDGKMIDLPIYKQAKRVCSRA